MNNQTNIIALSRTPGEQFASTVNGSSGGEWRELLCWRASVDVYGPCSAEAQQGKTKTDEKTDGWKSQSRQINRQAVTSPLASLPVETKAFFLLFRS